MQNLLDRCTSPFGVASSILFVEFDVPHTAIPNTKLNDTTKQQLCNYEQYITTPAACFCAVAMLGWHCGLWRHML